jgi:hypothetical protein
MGGPIGEMFKFHIPNSIFHIPDSKLQIPNCRFQAPDSRFQNPDSTVKIPVPSVKSFSMQDSLIPGLEFGIWNLELLSRNNRSKVAGGELRGPSASNPALQRLRSSFAGHDRAFHKALPFSQVFAGKQNFAMWLLQNRT